MALGAKYVLIAGVNLTSLLAIPPAFAQPLAAPAVSGQSGLEEIIVTARRREEAIQDVPVAVTALNHVALLEHHVDSALALQALVPSLIVISPTQRDSANYTLRGQGATLSAGPAVVAYFAEVPLPLGNLASVSQGGGPGFYFDLEDIQVLNGPQGTLFGRNTTGGAVLIEPKRPTGAFEGYAQLQFGSYNDHEFEGALDIPIVQDKLLLRVSGTYAGRDGFTKDVKTGVDYDNRNYWAGRVGLTFRPTDNIENYLLLNGIFDHTNGTSAVPLAVLPAGRAATLFPGGVFAANLAAQQARGIREVSLSATPVTREQYWGVEDILRWDIDENLTARNIASFSRFKYLNTQDDDGSPLAILDVTTPINTWNTNMNNFTEEAQLQGKYLNNDFNWVIGAYAEYDAPAGLQNQQTTQFFGSPFVAPASAVQSQLFSETRRDHAIYAQATYDLGNLAELLDKVKFTAGYRYTWDFKYDTTDAALPLLGFECANTPATFRPNCTAATSESSSAPTWTFGLDYKVTPDVLVYAKGSRGYKAGGANPTSVNPATLTFSPEFVTDVEIGAKTDWNIGGIKGRANLDAFTDDYANIQRTGAVFFNGRTGSATINAASATIRGVEFSGVVNPTSRIEIQVNYSYLDAAYNQFLLGTVDLTQEPFANVPRHKYAITTRYSVPINPDWGDLNLSATYSYQAKYYAGVTTIEPTAYVPGYGLLDLRIDWKGVLGSPLDAAFFVNNATDKAYQLNDFVVFTTLGYTQAIYGEPRTFGVQLRYKFGQSS